MIIRYLFTVQMSSRNVLPIIILLNRGHLTLQRQICFARNDIWTSRVAFEEAYFVRAYM